MTLKLDFTVNSGMSVKFWLMALQGSSVCEGINDLMACLTYGDCILLLLEAMQGSGVCEGKDDLMACLTHGNCILLLLEILSLSKFVFMFLSLCYF